MVSGKNSEDSMWAAYKKAHKPNEQVKMLLALADQYDLRNDMDGRDSIFDLAVDNINIKTTDSLLVKLYTWYFDKEEEYFTDRAIDHVKNFTGLNNKNNNNTAFYNSYYAKAKLALYQYNTKDALESAGEAFYYASLTNNPEIKVKAMLLLGNCLELSNKKVEAFKKYTDALYLSKENENNDLIYRSYQSLASFYFLIDNIEKAKEYKTEQFRILQAQPALDSLKFIKLSINLAGFLFYNKEEQQAEKITKVVLEYAVRHNYIRFKVLMFGTYRTYLINNGNFKKLSDLYTNQYPAELVALETRNPSLYYRLKAFMTEAENKPDSSEYYYRLAESKLSSGGQDNVYLSNFYKRYGEFLVRRGKITEAESRLRLAFKHAETAEYITYLKELSNELDSLLYSQGKTAEAYQYAKLNQKYNKQAELAQAEEELLKLEIDNEARERELKVKQEADATERRHNVQYMGISIVIIFSFLVLAMLGQFKVHKVVVKALGFFSFIFFFEFVIMLADHKIHHFTHGEPWKFLGFKIILIAGLLPLHHWLEEKVIHYLVSHKMVDTSRISFKSFLVNIKNNIFHAKSKHKHETEESITTEHLGDIIIEEEVIEKK